MKIRIMEQGVICLTAENDKEETIINNLSGQNLEYQTGKCSHCNKTHLWLFNKLDSINTIHSH